MEVLEALREGRALIEKGWCQGHGALDEHGNPCWVHVPWAAQHCTVGAASCVTYEDPETTYSHVLTALAGALQDLWEVEVPRIRPWDSVDALREWNDSPGRSKNEVVRLWSRAIEIQEQMEEA